MARTENAYRLPRKGDRVRFWEGGRLDGCRVQVTATVLARRGRHVDVEIDGRDGTFSTPTRKMEIL